MTAKGYAAKFSDGSISMKTVGDTKIAAMVNWLWVYTQYRPTTSWNDDRVTETFNYFVTNVGVSCVEVTVTEVDSSQ